MSGPVRTVLVMGDDIAAATAALALARAYGRLGVSVTLARTGVTPGQHAALSATPDLRSFHRLLGVDERILLRETPATLSAGHQYAGWSGEGGGFLHAYGEAGSAFASLPFLQHWTRARTAGLRVALEDFCLAAAAARHGRIATEPQAGAAMRYGYHLDWDAYAALLLRRCEAEGVAVRDGSTACVEAADGAVRALQLANGDRVVADLFVDADGRLIDGIDPKGSEQRSTRCDRLLLASAATLDPLPLYSRVTAHPAGWISLVPLRDRTAVALVYSSEWMSDEEALRALPGLAGLPLIAQDAPAPFHVTARPRPWVGNCVAIGPAAGTPPALDAAPLLALQLAVGQLVLLFPVDRAEMPEAEIYNAEVAGQFARLSDFEAMHFHLNARAGEPFWDTARQTPVSPELRAKIALFRARGMFAHFDHEPFAEESWALCMTGHGLQPLGYDPQADRVNEGEAMAAFQAQLRAIAQQVGGMETHRAALARLGGARV